MLSPGVTFLPQLWPDIWWRKGKWHISSCRRVTGAPGQTSQEIFLALKGKFQRTNSKGREGVPLDE